MNIIFLDIDNVLNYGYVAGKAKNASFDDIAGFCPVLMDNLRKIVDNVPDVGIVISSSWRTTEIMEHISTDRPWIEVFEEKLGRKGIVVDKIGIDNEFGTVGEDDKGNWSRADDILAWLDQNRQKYRITRFVVIDDYVSAGEDMGKKFPNNFVDCDKGQPQEGLTENKAKEAMWILSGYGRDKPMTNNTFFTSDQHFNHANIIKYCNRPFKDTQEMNEVLMEKWNSTVGKNDIVWCLGDICLGDRNYIPELVSKLNGRINLVMGNHDTRNVKFYMDSGFHRVYDRPVLINGMIVLSHEPLEWVQEPMFNIFGHVHDNPIYKTFSRSGCCVCVERHDYAPISWKTLKEKCLDDVEEDAR